MTEKGHTTSKLQNWGFNPSNLAPQFTLLTFWQYMKFRMPWILSNKSFRSSVLRFVALEDGASPKLIYSLKMLHTDDNL